MSPEAAIRIITDEELYIAPYNWFEEKRATEDEVGLIKKDHQWQVYVGGEKNSIIDIKLHDSIESALDDFIKRFKASKNIILERFDFFDKRNKQHSLDDYNESITDRKKMI